MKLKHAYLLMTIPGALLPCALLAGYFQQVGVDVPLFLQTIFTANLASAAAAADLFISGAVFFLFVFAEGRKRQACPRARTENHRVREPCRQGPKTDSRPAGRSRRRYLPTPRHRGVYPLAPAGTTARRRAW